MWLRKDLKLRAKEAVSRNYWKTVLVSALFSLIFSGGSFFTFKLGDADEIIDDIFYAFPFGLFFMFIAGLLLIAAVILFIIFILLNLPYIKIIHDKTSVLPLWHPISYKILFIQ